MVAMAIGVSWRPADIQVPTAPDRASPRSRVGAGRDGVAHN